MMKGEKLMRDVEMTIGYSIKTRRSSRMSVVDGGRTLLLYPRETILEKMKAEAWTHVKGSWRFDDADKLVGFSLKKAGPEEQGIAIRYPMKGRSPHIPIPTKDIGVATVNGMGSSHGDCTDVVEEDGFFFRIRGCIAFEKNADV
jgi:hypothetical protein